MAEEWPISSDVVETITGLSAGGGYLNSADVTYAVTTLAGAAVSGGTGSFAYTAASNGDYTAVLESTFTSTLTDGEEYLFTVTISSGSYNRTEYLKRRARKHDNPLVTLGAYQSFAGISTTDATRDASLAAILRHAEAAVRKSIRPFVPTPTTVTDLIMDAPSGPALVLPLIPVRSITSIYLNWSADGQAANFDSTHLLDADQYYMPVDTLPENYSRSGVVYRRGLRSTWGYERVRRVGRLGSLVTPGRGSLKVSFLAGPTSVPDDLALAVCLITSMVYHRRERGAPFASESWNGRSESVAGPFLVSALSSPDVAEILNRYRQVGVGVA